MRKLASILLICILFSGCAVARVDGDSVRLTAFGQADARHCPESEDSEGCTIVNGGPISDGATSLLKDLIRLPFVIIAGAARGVAGTP